MGVYVIIHVTSVTSEVRISKDLDKQGLDMQGSTVIGHGYT